MGPTKKGPGTLAMNHKWLNKTGLHVARGGGGHGNCAIGTTRGSGFTWESHGQQPRRLVRARRIWRRAMGLSCAWQKFNHSQPWNYVDHLDLVGLERFCNLIWIISGQDLKFCWFLWRVTRKIIEILIMVVFKVFLFENILK
jgi:hypothetical protein